MPRVVLVGNLAQLTGGVAEFRLSATSVKQLFSQLAELHPALEPHLAEGVAVAIDGQIYQDALFQPISADSEGFLLPRIAGGGGWARGRPPRGLGVGSRGSCGFETSVPAALPMKSKVTMPRGRGECQRPFGTTKTSPGRSVDSTGPSAVRTVRSSSPSNTWRNSSPAG